MNLVSKSKPIKARVEQLMTFLVALASTILHMVCFPEQISVIESSTAYTYLRDSISTLLDINHLPSEFLIMDGCLFFILISMHLIMLSIILTVAKSVPCLIYIRINPVKSGNLDGSIVGKSNEQDLTVLPFKLNPKLSNLKSKTVKFSSFLFLTFASFVAINIASDYTFFSMVRHPHLIAKEAFMPRTLTGIVTNYATIFSASTRKAMSFYVDATADKRYAVTMYYSGLSIYNITDQMNPIYLSTPNTGGGYFRFKFSADGKYIYAAVNKLYRLTFVDGIVTQSFSVSISGTPMNVIPTSNVIWVGTNSAGFVGMNASNLTQQLCSVNIGQTSDMMVSADEKTLYVVKVSTGVYVYDVTNPSSPVQRQIISQKLARAMDITPNQQRIAIAEILTIYNSTDLQSLTQLLNYTATRVQQVKFSPDGTKLYVSAQSSGISVYDMTSPTVPQVGYIFTGSDAYGVKFLDSTTMVLACSDGIKLATLTPPPMVNVVPPLTFKFNYTQSSYHSRVSYSGNYLYLGTNVGLRVFNIAGSNIQAPSLIASTGNAGIGFVRALALSPDDKTLFICGNNLIIYNVTNPASPVIIKSFTTPATNYDCIVSSDGYVFLAEFSTSFSIIDCRNLSNPVSASRVTGILTGSHSTLSLDEKYYTTGARIFDVSNRTNPKFSSFTPGVLVTTLSSNGKIGYGCSGSSFGIYDLSDWTAPIKLSSMSVFSCNGLRISRDDTVLYNADDTGGIKVISVSDPKNPTIVNGVPGSRIYDIFLSNDGTTLYASDINVGLLVYDITTNTALNISQNYLIGESSSQKMQLFKKQSTYVPFPSYFDVINMEMLSVLYDGQISTSVLPTWIYFNPSLGNIVFTPNSPDSFGSYVLKLSISTQVPISAFVGVGAITTLAESTDLVGALIDRGYLDPSLFLTSSFNPANVLLLSSTYSTNEAAYRAVLSNYFYYTLNFIYVNSSLNIDLANTTGQGVMPINMTSMSSGTVTVKINLYNNSYFITQKLPILSVYTTDFSGITITGSVSDIQNCLSLIRINSTSGCDGLMTVNDQMNPTVTKFISKISNYFIIQQNPYLVTIPFANNVTNVSIVKGSSLQFGLYFKDPNSAENLLTYSFQTYSNGVLNALNPVYMRIDSTTGVLYVNPTTSDCTFDTVNSVYYADLMVVVTAKNSGGLTASYQFAMHVRNAKPAVMIPLQPQVNRYILLTGFSFSIKFDPNSFVDFTGDKLIYTLSAASGDSISGISYKDTDYSLEGTAPTEIGTKNLVLIVSNGLQSTQEYFQLEFKPSVSYWFNILITYGGALLGIIGFYAYMPIIYNILCGYRYKYPKKFTVAQGAEINDSTVFPICFIGEYNALATNLYNTIEKRIRSSVKHENIKTNYLIKGEQTTFDKRKLRQDIEQSCDITSEIKLDILTEMIKDKIVLQAISNDSKYYNDFSRLSKHWYNLVEVVPKDIENHVLSSLLAFKIKKEILLHTVPKSIKVAPHDDSNKKMLDKQNTPRDEEILSHPDDLNLTAVKHLKAGEDIEINAPPPSESLLTEALLAHARTNQNINLDPTDVEVVIKKRDTNVYCSSLQRMLKFDLKEAGDGDDKTYGLEAKVENKALKFNGTPTFDFPGNKIYVQLIKKGGITADFILREMTIEGMKEQKGGAKTKP